MSQMTRSNPGGGLRRSSRERRSARLRRRLAVVALALAAGSLAAAPVQAEESGPSPDLVAEIEERIASLEAQGKANAKQRWERALAAVRCEPGAMGLDEIERRAKRRFNTELWAGVLAAARACAEDPPPDADAGSDADTAPDDEPQFFGSSRSEPEPSAAPQPEPGPDAGGAGTPSDIPPAAMDPGDGGDDGELPYDAVTLNQDPPNRRPVRLDAWPGSLTFLGTGGTVTLTLSAEFSDPDGDTLTYSTVSLVHGGGDHGAVDFDLDTDADELVVTAQRAPSITSFTMTAKDGNSDCPTSSGGTMECRVSSSFTVYVHEMPQRSDADWIDVEVRPYGVGLEGISGMNQGGSAQGCVPFAFDLSRSAPTRFAYEYRIVPVPESTVLYGLGGSSKGAPASFFDDNTTNVWRQAGFQHHINELGAQTTGGFCVQLKGVTAIPNNGANNYSDHCPKGERRHFYVDMRIPQYWEQQVGVRMVDGKTRSIMNLTCQ